MAWIVDAFAGDSTMTSVDEGPDGKDASSTGCAVLLLDEAFRGRPGDEGFRAARAEGEGVEADFARTAEAEMKMDRLRAVTADAVAAGGRRCRSGDETTKATRWAGGMECSTKRLRAADCMT